MVIFHSYVKLPEGIYRYIHIHIDTPIRIIELLTIPQSPMAMQSQWFDGLKKRHDLHCQNKHGSQHSMQVKNEMLGPHKLKNMKINELVSWVFLIHEIEICSGLIFRYASIELILGYGILSKYHPDLFVTQVAILSLLPAYRTSGLIGLIGLLMLQILKIRASTWERKLPKLKWHESVSFLKWRYKKNSWKKNHDGTSS